MTSSTRPTSIRYVILGLTVVVAVLLYLDRYCIGFVLPYIKEGYGLSEEKTRFLVSAFFYTYALGQIPGGWLSDRFGTRLMLSLYLAIWSALTGLTGFAQGFAMLLMFRFGCGLFEAGAYPACAGLIRRWFPYAHRGLASGIVSIGGRLGGAVTQPATGYLMLLFMPIATAHATRDLESNSWQPVLMIFGAVGIVVAVIFWGFYRDSPRQHFLCNEAEAQLVEAHEPATPAPPFRAIVRGLCTNTGLWACSVVQFGTNFVWIFLGNEFPTFLDRVYHVPLRERLWMGFWPFFIGPPMLIIGGWWTDWLTRKFGPRLGRSLPLVTTRLAGAAAMVGCWYLDAPWPITIALCLFAMATDLGLPATWAYSLDVGGRNAGLVLGWGNMIGNLGAAVSATAFGFVLRRYVDVDSSPSEYDLKAGYGAVFLTGAAVYFVIGFLSFFVDATKPIGIPDRGESV